MNYKINKDIRSGKILTYMFIACLAIIGAQRFSLDNLYAYVCIFPFISSIFCYQKDRSLSLVFLVISLFLSVDQGAGWYFETPAAIRYSIYIWGIFFITQWGSISQSKLIIYLFMILPPVLITIFSVDIIDSKLFIRDIFIAVIIGLALTKGNYEHKQINIEPKLLTFFFVVFLFCELLNIIFFYSIENNHYLNYSSLKGLIVFSFFFLIYKKKYFLSLFLGLVILSVLMEYGSRMPLLMFFLLTTLYLVKITFKRLNVKNFFLLALFFIIIFFVTINFTDNSKFGYMVNRIWITESFREWFMLVDPTRYFENLLFFERDFFSIIFGNGFGSGLSDSNGYLYFVQPNQTAFTLEELNSGVYYNFHDFWVDIGLRFGLLNILLFVYLVTKRFLNDSDNSYIFLTFFLLLFTVFYTSAGILLISLFLILTIKKRSNLND